MGGLLVAARRALGLGSAEDRHALVGSPELWRMKREFQVAFLKSRGLGPGDWLLDLGCGTLRGGIPLIAYLEAGHYAGVESRAKVLAEGRKELREAGLEHKGPVLRVSDDLAGLNLGRNYDVVWAFSVLIHMTDAILREAMGFASRHMHPGSSFYANVNIGDAKARSWQGFPVMTRPIGFYESEAERAGMRVEVVGMLGDLGHVSGHAAQDRQPMLRMSLVG